MGRLQAEELAERVDLDTALEYHLQYNHYPPVAQFKDVCKKAIELGQQALEEDENEDSHGHSPKWQELVDLPEGVTWRGRDDDKAPVGEVLETFHLDSFLHTTIEPVPCNVFGAAVDEPPMEPETERALAVLGAKIQEPERAMRQIDEARDYVDRLLKDMRSAVLLDKLWSVLGKAQNAPPQGQADGSLDERSWTLFSLIAKSAQVIQDSVKRLDTDRRR